MIFLDKLQSITDTNQQANKNDHSVYLLPFQEGRSLQAIFSRCTTFSWSQWLESLTKCVNSPLPFQQEFLSKDQDNYIEDVERIQEEIRSGNVYQVNLTRQHYFPFPGELSLYALWLKLYARQISSNASFLQLPEIKIASLSPELFFSVEDGTILSEPMKGTANNQDAAIQTMLLSEKERAENAMIADLIRNDIARVAEFGSVQVPKSFYASQYQTIAQMSTQVCGKLEKDIDIPEVLDALHPPGSISGAPKIAALQLIDQLETESRGYYTGAIGFKLSGGRAQFNVLIRTLQQTSTNQVQYGSGAGITIDSDPHSEYYEMLAKTKILFDDYPEAAIETIRFVRGRCYWLQDHMKRLAESYEYLFQKSLPEKTLNLILRFSKRLPQQRGLLRVQVSPKQMSIRWFSNPKQRSWLTVRIAETRLCSSWDWLFHKTTRRSLYRTYTALAQKEKLADFLFFNENNELCEGAISNIFIYRDGRYITPPLAGGLLGGVMRSKLLKRFQLFY